MLKIFGKAKKQAPPSPQQSVDKLNESLDLMQKREAHLQKKIDDEMKIAKANATKNKKVAMMALRRKKQYETQIQQIQNTILTLEQQKNAIENAQIQIEAITALQAGAQTMKRINKNMTVDQVADVLDEIQEQMDVNNEIIEALNQPIAGQLVDDDELEAELLELENAGLEEQYTTVSTPVDTSKYSQNSLNKLPGVPSQAPKSEEDELAELQASMAF